MSIKLFLVHCGFYDMELLGGIYESHVNFLVVATSYEEARAKAKLEPEFQKKRMHVDGLQQIEAVNGYRIQMVEDEALRGRTEILSHRHRDLAPPAPPVASPSA